MTDSQFRNLYSDDAGRREQFQAARDRVRAACGEHTLAGDLLLPGFATSISSPTPPPPIPPADAPACHWLQDGDKLYPLVVGVNGVGRLPDNAVVIRDEHVSRRHCAIVIHRDGQAELHDVASKNGTVLNGNVIAGPTRIRPGDRIRLCSRDLVFLSRPRS
jgi:hypothetical protein